MQFRISRIKVKASVPVWNELQAAFKEAGVWMKDRNGSSSAEMGEPVSPWVGAPLPAPGAWALSRGTGEPQGGRSALGVGRPLWRLGKDGLEGKDRSPGGWGEGPVMKRGRDRESRGAEQDQGL